MEINVDKTGPCTVKVSISISSEEVSEEMNNNIKQTANAVAFPGFRKGKAPKKLVLKKFGDLIKDDVKEKLLRDAVTKAIEENKLEPVSEPSLDLSTVEVEEGKPIDLDFELEIKPEFELGDYKKFEIDVKPSVVNDAEIDEGIKALQSRFAFLKTVTDTPVDKKHYITCDLTYKIEGEEDINRENSQANISLGIIDGIELKDDIEKFLGKNIEEEVELEIAALPKHFMPEELRGKPAILHAKIKETKEITFPELDDEFLKKINVESVEKLRENINSEISEQKSTERDNEIEAKCVDQLIERTPFDIPEKLLMNQVTQQEQNIRYELMRMGLPQDKVEEEAGKMGDKNREAAIRNIKANFIYDNIAEKESVYVTENEIEAELKSVAQQQNMDVEAVRAHYEEKNLTQSLRTFLRNQKIRRMLSENATITEKEENEITEDPDNAASNSEEESSI